MRKSVTAIVILLAVVSFGAKKWQAYVGWDKNVNFEEIKTFAYEETLSTSVVDSAPHTHEMIKLLIIIQLQNAGMTLVEEDPDVFVTYHTNQDQAMRTNVTMYQYHYSAGWWWSPLWGSGMDVASYTKGTLVVDIWNPKTEELVWRGAVQGVVKDDLGPKKAQKTIEKALNKIGEEYRKQKSKTP